MKTYDVRIDPYGVISFTANNADELRQIVDNAFPHNTWEIVGIVY